MSEINPLSGLYNDFVSIAKKCVIKYDKKAREFETIEMTKAGEQYISALRREDNFFSYMNYEKSLLNKVGIYDETVLPMYMENRRNIPEKYRSQLLELKRKKVIEEYVENNNYYRMLNGQPDIDDRDFIYLTQDMLDLIESVPTDVPVHLLEDFQILILKENKVFDKLFEMYPDKSYLHYLGSEKIPIDIARKARNFELLRLPVDLSDVTRGVFPTIYEQCRYYFMNVIYVQEYVDVMPYYDEFISLCIMFMAIQQTTSRTIENIVNRDFFDEYLIKLLYESYKMPYITDLPFDIQKDIARNLNMLIQYKSTDKVLYDVASLLGYDSISIYKYYLIKEQKFDITGNPVIANKKIINDEGLPEEVPDYEAMYDLYFRQIELTERDYFKAMQNSRNKRGYHEITDSDPYWWEDDELYNQIYESEYNYAETKYLGISITYKLTEVMFETVYLIRMLFDKKNEVSNIMLDLPKIDDRRKFNLFECITMLCMITCRRNQLKGEILMSPSKILHVLGFNFKQDFATIKQHIKDSKYLDNEMIKYIENMQAITPESVNRLYNNIEQLRDFMSEKMGASHDIDEYRAYCKLYEALYISEENGIVFDISEYTNGEKQYADTYDEYVKYTLPHVYELIVDADDSTLVTYARHIISKINSVIEDIKYLYLLNNLNDSVIDALIKLIKFFKSYTTDLIDLNIIYIFDTKALNMLKLIDKIEYIEKTIEPHQSVFYTHGDYIDLISAIIYHKDEAILRDFIKTITTLSLSDKINLHDNLFVNAVMEFMDILMLYDSVSLETAITIADAKKLILSDMLRMYSEVIYSDKIDLDDICKVVVDYFGNDKVDVYDTIQQLTSAINLFSNNIHMLDKVSIQKEALFTEEYIVKDVLKIISEYNEPEYLQIYDYIKTLVSTIKLESNTIKMRDRIAKYIANIFHGENFKLIGKISKFISEITNREKVKYFDQAHIDKTIHISDRMNLSDKINNIK